MILMVLLFQAAPLHAPGRASHLLASRPSLNVQRAKLVSLILPASYGKWWYPWDGGPLVINLIYTLYSGYLLGISPFKGLLGGLKQLGYHPRVPAFSLWQPFLFRKCAKFKLGNHETTKFQNRWFQLLFPTSILNAIHCFAWKNFEEWTTILDKRAK